MVSSLVPADAIGRYEINVLYSDAGKRSDWELVFVYGLVWIAALARVIWLLAHHTAFGIEASLAALVVVGLPILAARSLRGVKET